MCAPGKLAAPVVHFVQVKVVVGRGEASTLVVAWAGFGSQLRSFPGAELGRSGCAARAEASRARAGFGLDAACHADAGLRNGRFRWYVIRSPHGSGRVG